MNCTRFAAAGIAAMALGVALPSVASAEDYCVAPNYDCGANNVQKLQDALDLAKSTQDADRVLLGEATYFVPAGQKAFLYKKNGPVEVSPVEIVGAGRGKTVLSAPDGSAGEVLALDAGQESSVRDLTVRIPAKVANDFCGLLLTDGTARRVELIEDKDQVGPRTGVAIWHDGTLEDSTVTLADGPHTTGVTTYNPVLNAMISLRGVTVSAGKGLRSNGFLTVERSRITGSGLGVVVEAGDTTIVDSLVRQPGTIGRAIQVGTDFNYDGRLTADGLTVIGGNTADNSGIVATTEVGPKRNVEVKLSNSVIRGVQNPLAAMAGDTGEATITSSYSDYAYGDNWVMGGHIYETHVTNADDPGFVDPANGDYRLRAGSPLVDRGDPDAPQGLDIDGNPLVADGNRDGFARRDIGAFELQPQPAPQPQPQGDTQAPLISGFRARRSAVSYRLSESARVVVKIQRRLAGKRARYRIIGKLSANASTGANRTRVGARLRRKEARPGRYRAVIVAVDGAGNRSAPKTASFRVRRR